MTPAATQSGEVEWRAWRAQSRILKDSARFLVWNAGRRSGKTEVGVAFLFSEALRLIQEGHDPESLEVWWVAPTWELAKRGFNKVKKGTKEDGTPNPFRALFHRSTESPGNMSIYTTAGFRIQFKQAEKEDQLRGEGVHAVVVDEAAMMRQSAWTEALYPAMSRTRARALIISTPKGRNWFHALWQRGHDPTQSELRAFTSPSWESPYCPAPVIQQARLDLPDRVYRQEYGAEFLTDGAFFRRVRSLITTAPDYRGPAASRGWDLQPERVPDARYVAGWDPAKHQDYSSLKILRLPERHVVHSDRWHGMEYDQQVRRVASACRHYGALLLMDATGAGDPLYDYLLREAQLEPEFVVVPYKFTSTSKSDLVNELAITIDQGSLSYPDLPLLVNELEVYEATTTAAGNVKYGAPEGLHDDEVTALALANLAASRFGSLGSGIDLDFSRYY